MKVLTGLIEPTEGGDSFSGAADVRSDWIGFPAPQWAYVPRRAHTCTHTLGGNANTCSWWGRLRGLASARAGARAWTRCCGCSHCGRIGIRRCRPIRKGMRQKKIFVCRARLLHDPELLILDEPFFRTWM